MFRQLQELWGRQSCVVCVWFGLDLCLGECFFFNIKNFPQFSVFQVINKAHSRVVLSPGMLGALWLGVTPLSSPSPANPEDQWQREISEKGEVACPTCSVITRKTIVGLKKHMDVCQKVRTCFIQSPTYGFWKGMDAYVCSS